MPKMEEERIKKIKEVFIKTLSGGTTFAKACEAAGIGRTTIWNWRKEDARFDDEVNFVIDARVQDVEDALYQNATEKNNVTAQIFWLINRSGGRWKDKQYFNNENTKILVKEPELTDEEINQMIDIAYKAIHLKEE